jgi:hypothetical protein
LKLVAHPVVSFGNSIENNELNVGSITSESNIALRYEVKKALVCTREKLREEMREMRGG